MNLMNVAVMVILGLLTWNVSTTQTLAVQTARLEASVIQRLERLELWTERLANRINALETRKGE